MTASSSRRQAAAVSVASSTAQGRELAATIDGGAWLFSGVPHAGTALGFGGGVCSVATALPAWQLNCRQAQRDPSGAHAALSCTCSGASAWRCCVSSLRAQVAVVILDRGANCHEVDVRGARK
tara:strand:+ start:2104 stop:2472 length:369 start_codon:yes stop_codon:yes gene_type:complete